MFLYAKVGQFFIGLWSTQVFLTATAVSTLYVVCCSYELRKKCINLISTSSKYSQGNRKGEVGVLSSTSRFNGVILAQFFGIFMG